MYHSRQKEMFIYLDVPLTKLNIYFRNNFQEKRKALFQCISVTKHEKKKEGAQPVKRLLLHHWRGSLGVGRWPDQLGQVPVFGVSRD